MQNTRQYVLMQRFPRVLPSLCSTSMLCPLLVVRGWKNFQDELILHEKTDKEQLLTFLIETCLENIPQLAIQQVNADSR